MKRPSLAAVIGLVLVASSIGAAGTLREEHSLNRTYPSSPLYFEANRAQSGESGKSIDKPVFFARGPGYSLSLAPQGFMLNFDGPQRRKLQGTGVEYSRGSISMSLAGMSNAAPQIIGFNEQTTAGRFGSVKYRQVYQGIDQTYYGNAAAQLEFDFIVAPGADYRQIKMHFDGVLGAHVDARGQLVLETSAGDVKLAKPVTYQEINGYRSFCDSSFVVDKNGDAGFRVGAYDPELPLIIDPVLSYSTYLGGKGNDQAISMAIDPLGNVYITGATTSREFSSNNSASPDSTAVEESAYDDVFVFVAKLNPTGNLVYVKYFGGSSRDYGLSIAVDRAGNAYVGGVTWSPDFPATTGTCNITAPMYYSKAFAAKLNAAGEIDYMRCVGGSVKDYAVDIAVDSEGNAYLAGQSYSPDFTAPHVIASAATHPYWAASPFITKLNPTGDTILYTAAIDDQYSLINSIAVDSSGAVYIAGSSTSDSFPTVHALQSVRKGEKDGFIAKINPAGTALVYSTYLGGDGTDEILDIALDGKTVYAVGVTDGLNFPLAHALPTFGSGIGPAWSPNAEAFVSQLDSTGESLLFSTYLGGSGTEFASGVAVDNHGAISITGQTRSTDFPLQHAMPHLRHGFTGVFISKIDAAHTRLVYSTVLGGSIMQWPRAVAVDDYNSTYISGFTASPDYPTTPGVFQEAEPGGRGNIAGYVTKLGPPSVYLR